MADNWIVFGFVLAVVLIFATLVAFLTRTFEKNLEGHTYELVVLGVGGVVVISGFVVGWNTVLFILACFFVASIPMGIEFYSRAIAATRKAKQANEDALMEGSQHVHTSTDRQE